MSAPRASLAERLARSRARVVDSPAKPDSSPAKPDSSPAKPDSPAEPGFVAEPDFVAKPDSVNAPVSSGPPVSSGAPPRAGRPDGGPQDEAGRRLARLEQARRLLRQTEDRWKRSVRERPVTARPPAAPAVPVGPAVREPFRREDHEFPLDSDYAGGALGRLPLVSPELAARLNLQPDEPGVDLGRAVFVDTETSGLAGGTGTFAFLIGAGWVEDGRFRIAQFLLRDPSAERAMLESFAGLVDAGRDLVTYNGKSFDVPLLETRFALNALPAPFRRSAHLDLLPPARRLFKPGHESAKLGHLERSVLGVERDDDIPGAGIPQVFFEFLHAGHHPLMKSVLSHNRYDLLTLAALAVRAAERLEDDWDSEDPASLHGVGDHLWRREESERAVSFLERALAAGLGGRLRDRCLLQLGEHWKRLDRWDAACDLWGQVADLDIPERLDALVWFAKHEEHRRGDFGAALLHVEDALERLSRVPLRPERLRAWRESLDHRAARLRRRAGEQGSPAAERRAG